MDKRTVAAAHERIDEMQIQVAEIRIEVKIQLKEVFARVKRLEAMATWTQAQNAKTAEAEKREFIVNIKGFSAFRSC